MRLSILFARLGVFALILSIHMNVGAQLSFLPISSSEGIGGNTSVARSASSLAPLSNPATAAPRSLDDSVPANEASISSNIYMISKVEVRGRGDLAAMPVQFSSIPTSLGGRKRFAGAHATFGIYQTEHFRFDYRDAESEEFSGRMTALFDVNRAGAALAFSRENMRYGVGLCFSSYSLKTNSQFISMTNPQLGALSSSWEERSRTDVSLSAGLAMEIDEDKSFGFAIRSPSLGLFQNTDGQKFFAVASPSAGSSSLEKRALDDSNRILGNGIEGVAGISIRSEDTEFSAEVAMFESLGSSIGALAGETQLRFGVQQGSTSNKMIYGLMLGVADALGNDIFPNRKSIPFTISIGFDREIDQLKRLSLGVFHTNAIDWELENTDRFSYSVFQRTGLVISGSFSL